MADWTYIPTKGAEWRPNSKRRPLPELKPAHNHTLEYQRKIDRWVCGCGYKLGDGRAKLLAPCPLAKKPKTSHEKHDRFSKTFLQGELLPPLEEEPPTKSSKRKKQTNAKPKKRR